MTSLMFQSTHPHGVRQAFCLHWLTEDKFQSTHPHGVRQQYIARLRERFRSFNPRTHTGCDDLLIDARQKLQVSIHAPTRGATPSAFSVSNTWSSFNPRTHTGCDAPCVCVLSCAQSFNPRTHTGCDVVAYKGFLTSILFQSTHPHGVRRLHLCVLFHSFLFQSTHPHGVRLNG